MTEQMLNAIEDRVKAVRKSMKGRGEEAAGCATEFATMVAMCDLAAVTQTACTLAAQEYQQCVGGGPITI